MKKITFLLFALISFSSQAQIVNIPDAALKTGLLEYQPAIDTNGDDEIQVSEALAITSLKLNDNGNYITGNVIDFTGLEVFSNLNTLYLKFFSGLTSFDFSVFPNLQDVNFSNCPQLTSVNLTGLTNLQHLDGNGCFRLTSLNLNGLTNLQTLNCSNVDVTTLDISGLSNLTNLDCSGSRKMTSLITIGANNMLTLDCNSCALTSLNVTGMTNLQSLICSDQQPILPDTIPGITSLDLSSQTALTNLNCSSNNLTSLTVSNLTNLTTLNCMNNHITALNVSPLVNLTNLYCGGNPITSLDVAALVNLSTLFCHSAALSSINVNTLTNLLSLDCSNNNISSLNVSNNTALLSLYCSSNHLTALDVSNLLNLRTLFIASNQMTTLDVSNLHFLTAVNANENLFTELDFSQSLTDIPFPTYGMYALSLNPNLTHVNLKNGRNMAYASYSFYQCPSLQYICANETDIQGIQQELEFNSMGGNTPQNVPVNSYCTFVPGGINNVITGTVTLDHNNNGCDSTDIHPRNFRININDGSTTGATFSNENGAFSFFNQSGNYTLTPQFENPYFIASPATTVVSFPTLDGSTQTRDFCVTANGIHNDVDVVLFRAINVTPGYDVRYALSYRNKGNQILSGNINFTFDDTVIDYVSATPEIDSQTINNLNWNYSNLLPFESRTIYMTLNLNSPMETPPLNLDDILTFTATINPIAGDETPIDNSMTLSETVINSFDPNDKTCLEGNFITPEKVGDYLHYVIRFQNSGTAPAQNIVVKDVIDATRFDINTLQLTASSHPQSTRITGDKVEFVFEGINLPAEVNDESGSHGFVAFKIKTKNTLVLGNTISNTAGIYFDYNFPIVTNTATTTITALSNHNFENTSVSMYPNPVQNTLTISAKDMITSIQLFDVQGRLITTKLNTSPEASLDLSQQQAGIYFVKVCTDNGMKVEKIIKE